MNTYNITNYPNFVEFQVFSQINANDLENSKLKVLVRKETNKSISLSLYVGKKCNSINKNLLSDAKYLKRETYSYFDNSYNTNYYLKITKEQSNNKLLDLIKRHVDIILKNISLDLDIDICIHRELKEYIKF